MVIKSKLSYKDLTKESEKLPENEWENQYILLRQKTLECEVCHGVMIMENTGSNKINDNYWFCTRCPYRKEYNPNLRKTE